MLGFLERLAELIGRLPQPVQRLLLPTTDLGVVVQVLLAAALLGVLWSLTRHRPEWRLVVLGAALLLFGLFGLRAAH